MNAVTKSYISKGAKTLLISAFNTFQKINTQNTKFLEYDFDYKIWTVFRVLTDSYLFYDGQILG